MSKNNLFILIVLCFLSLSCQKEDPYGLNQLSDNVLVATGSATDIGSFTARLHGSVNIEALASSSFTFKFIYGETPDLKDGTLLTATNVENNCYAIHLTSLVGDNEYYYRAVLEINGNYCFGEIKEFQTNATPELCDYIGKWKCETSTFSPRNSKKVNWNGLDTVEITEEYVKLPIGVYSSSTNTVSFIEVTFNPRLTTPYGYLAGHILFPNYSIVLSLSPPKLNITYLNKDELPNNDNIIDTSYECHRY